MRFLCVSDIHGHAVALQAVLHEASERGFDQLVVCGDLCFPGPAPLAVWRLLVEHSALCVQGLTDRALVEVDPDRLDPRDGPERARLERFREVRAELGEPILARIAGLPLTAELPLESGHTLQVVHGSPLDPTEAITPDLSDEEIIALLGAQSADIVVCGAGHVSFDRQIGAVRVVGVGSVGEAPGGEYAHATLIVSTANDVTAEPMYVELASDRH
jgi:predicted phosphodiesterase